MKNIFISEFFKERKVVGAIAPSSKFLMRKILSQIDFSKDINIVELGPGTGIFTAEILKRMSRNSTLFSFEINPSFYTQLKSKISDDRLNLICDSAENMQEHLNKNGIKKVDIIISSLPLAVIPVEIKDNILNTSLKVLDKKGVYVQFQYSLNAKKLLKSKFENVKIDFTVINLPPAFIYHCTN